MDVLQSTARRVDLKLFDDAGAAATGRTLAVVLSKDGGAFANPSAGATNATEIANGWYCVLLSTTDTNTLGDLVVRGTATGCQPAERILNIVADSAAAAATLDLLTYMTVAEGVGGPIAARRYTASALQNGPTGDAVWTEAQVAEAVSQLAKIGSVAVVTRSLVDAGGNVETAAGAAYPAGVAPSWTFSSPGNLSAATAVVKITNRETNAVVLSLTGNITQTGGAGAATIEAPITAAQSDDLAAGTEYNYEVSVLFSGAAGRPLARGSWNSVAWHGGS